jgi:hypothetical protein
VINILVYGWYNHSNLGDDLFEDAFKNLFPDYNFKFQDYIDEKSLKNIENEKIRK